MHNCPYKVGLGEFGHICVFHDHDDEVCLECLNDQLVYIHNSIVDIRKILFKRHRKEINDGKKKKNDKV